MRHLLALLTASLSVSLSASMLAGCAGESDTGQSTRPQQQPGARTTTTSAAAADPAAGSGADSGARAGSTGPLRVIRVVDGDTIVVALDGEPTKVRYIGVDTPESVKPNTPVECFAKKATALNRSLVEGRRVTLRFDREREDRYGRLLAYVTNDSGVDVNARLIDSGAARTMEISPNTSRARTFAKLEDSARRDRRGMWAECDRSQDGQGSLVLSTR